MWYNFGIAELIGRLLQREVFVTWAYNDNTMPLYLNHVVNTIGYLCPTNCMRKLRAPRLEGVTRNSGARANATKYTSVIVLVLVHNKESIGPIFGQIPDLSSTRGCTCTNVGAHSACV